MSYEHLDFILGLPSFVEADGCLVVHAELLPDVPYEKQPEKFLNQEMNPGEPWIHEKRLVTAEPPPDCPVIVVAGYVRFPEVVIPYKRILIDTTGGRHGRLSAVLLPERRVLKSTMLI